MALVLLDIARMRIAIAVFTVLSLSACMHKSHSSGLKSMGASFKKLGKDVAAIVPIKTDIKVKVDTASVLALAQQHAQAAGPITLNKSIHRSSTSSGDEAPPPATSSPMPEPVVTRTTVSSGGDQVWKNTWRDGEKASCEKASTFDGCQSECTASAKEQSMLQLQPGAGKPLLCECTQGYSKC